MSNKAGEEFILTIKFYKSSNDAALFYPKKWKPEGEADV